jgi:bla regulator protein blaR1
MQPMDQFEIIRGEEQLMRYGHFLIRSLSLSAAATLSVIPSASSAQSTPSLGPQFEVASVRPIQPPNGKSNPCNVTSKPLNLAIRTSGSKLTLRNETLAGLIRDAYNLRDDQFTGVPAWADCRDLYEIAAKAPGEGTPTPDQLRLMLQTLLADRFQLKLRHETRNLPVYELTVAKDGLKLKLTPERTTGNQVDQWGIIPLLIEGYLDYPIVDKTGLTGFVTGDLKWDDTELREEAKQGPASAPPGVFYRSLAPSIFHEVEVRFGLSLKKATPPSDFLIIEHVERPSEN